MKLSVLLPGKIKPKALAPAQEEYVRRLKAYGVDVAEYKDEKVSSRTPEQTRQAEAQRILGRLKENDYLVVCDERGKAIQTRELAERLTVLRQGGPPLTGRSRMVIVIGGALGLAESIRKEADEVWALSSLVLAGGVARIVLLEALFRGYTLVDHHPYHNE